MSNEISPAGNPLLSVIVAVKDGAAVLRSCLQALEASDLPRPLWELVVVDDGSLDSTASIASGLADVLVRLPGPPHGPAYARNRGVDASVGGILVFVDADVCVHPDALRRIAWALARRPELGAVFGSYDADSPARGVVSQYRNLRYHFVHHQEAGPAETFWAPLGAVRREVFVRAGRFDEWHFPLPQIEDIELGYRIRQQGYPILLDPSIQGRHLKRWSLRGMVGADLRDRGIPWIRLQLALGWAERPATLLFRRLEWVRSGLVCAAFVLVLLALRFSTPSLASIAGLLLVAVLASNHEQYRFFVRSRGPLFAVQAIPIDFLYYLANGWAAIWAWVLFHLIGPPSPPADIQAYAEKGIKTWPPQPVRPERSSWAGGGRRQSIR
jgi:cellulose synthase/poly-beta-1,6-N-acetylglucosamine synthase-like glycosyltransferase